MIRELMENYQSNFAKRKVNPNHQFQMRFKKKNTLSDYIIIKPRDLKKMIPFARFWKKLGPLKLREIMNIEHTVRITYHKQSIPYVHSVQTNSDCKRYKQERN